MEVSWKCHGKMRRPQQSAVQEQREACVRACRVGSIYILWCGIAQQSCLPAGQVWCECAMCAMNQKKEPQKFRPPPIVPASKRNVAGSTSLRMVKRYMLLDAITCTLYTSLVVLVMWRQW